ncbi:methyltransferase domain-containing protein [Kitasatospora brasiliensis]|uniref:methyltransferase domain-containing protein n=1 Tax=Kitasatospora brasiliensis TaxID=3058040 RepID=UPI002930521B|nr:methyltransferase domain-containing protein [Kitasatospora sp. K002]
MSQAQLEAVATLGSRDEEGYGHRSLGNYERSLGRSRESLTREDRPRTFTMYGREWDLFPEVFAPVYSPSTRVGVEFLGLAEPGSQQGGSFLEMGCGTGVVATMALFAGYDRAVASDINPMAVGNAVANADRHGVGHRLRAVQGDLFSGLAADERFDVVFWSSNYVLAPADYSYRSSHERAYVDPGYHAHRRYLSEAPLRVTPTGRALLHFSDRGDVRALYRAAEETGRTLRLLAARPVREAEYGDDTVEHLLFEIVPRTV